MVVGTVTLLSLVIFRGGDSDAKSLVLTKPWILLKSIERDLGPGFKIEGLHITIRVIFKRNKNRAEPLRAISTHFLKALFCEGLLNTFNTRCLQIEHKLTPPRLPIFLKLISMAVQAIRRKYKLMCVLKLGMAPKL